MPKLRFKDSEGREFPKWKEKKLGEIALCLDSQRVPVEKNRREEGKIPYYGANGIQGYVKDWLFDGEYVLLAEDGGHYNEYSSKPIAQFIQGKAWVNNHAHIIEADNRNNTKFLFYSLEHKDIRKYINGSTRGKLTQGDMWKILLCIPSLPEQQKIADFLTTVDRQIDIQSQRVEAMKNRKRGLLQKIFSQEIRFKNEQGQVYPEWIVQKLEELVSMHARIGWQNLRTSEFLNSGDYYLVTGTDFVNGKIDFSTCHYIGKERFEQDKKIQLDNDNILITKDGTLGKVAYVDILPKPTTLNAGIFCLKSKKQNINMKYLFQYLRGPFMMQYCNRHSTGGTIKHLNQGVLITFPVPLPSLSEQQKIADFLTAVDHQIEVEEKRLETMKTIKKGLLQQMFI